MQKEQKSHKKTLTIMSGFSFYIELE